MKRQILFRGKRTDNWKWIEGSLLIPSGLGKGIYISDKATFADFYPDFEEGHELSEYDGNGIAFGLLHEVHPESVGQFTGLTDRNGKMIFEGDIVKCGYGMGEVVFKSGCFMVDWLSDKGAYMEFVFSRHGMYVRKDDEVFEIIGNITDNPELLNPKP